MYHKENQDVNVFSSKSSRVTVTQCVSPALCQILEVKSPTKQTKQSKQDKNKSLDCDKVQAAIFLFCFFSIK